MDTPVVAVSIKSLFKAEHQIAGCSNCTDRVTVRFERVLDAVTKCPETTKYVLPAMAICPMCHHHLVESTMVQLRKDAHELVFVTRDELKAGGSNRKNVRSRRA
jgi:transcription elongation factor Elf1